MRSRHTFTEKGSLKHTKTIKNKHMTLDLLTNLAQHPLASSSASGSRIRPPRSSGGSQPRPNKPVTIARFGHGGGEKIKCEIVSE